MHMLTNELRIVYGYTQIPFNEYESIYVWLGIMTMQQLHACMQVTQEIPIF